MIRFSISTRISALAVCAAPLLMTACSSFSSPNSPDVLYDNNATEAQALQVPPDLTDVSNSEQFVLPGTADTAVARNTLLPQFSSVRFVRDGQQSWLAFDASPEDLWGQILAFARAEKYSIENTEPVAGVITTQWREVSVVASDGLLNNLINNEEEYSRIAFRLERNGNGARVFARSQVTSSEAVEEDSAGDTQWPASSHDPEATSRLLSRLMVFLGIEEQKVRGILSDEQARGVLENASLRITSAGNELIVHRGFQPSFKKVLAALQSLEYSIISRDDAVGRIEFSIEGGSGAVLELTPIHVSAVRLAVSDQTGRKLSAEQERQLLDSLYEQLV